MARGHHTISCLGRLPVIYLFFLPQCIAIGKDYFLWRNVNCNMFIRTWMHRDQYKPVCTCTRQEQNFCVRSCSDLSRVFNMLFDAETSNKRGMIMVSMHLEVYGEGVYLCL
uniref:Putative secreted protein n=1 Tax=Ixodes ricinus TaxID=34613 RepID=A0A6B0UJB9_IXORI